MMCTTETYILNGEYLPTIPTPHDCVVEEIALEDGWLILRFERDVSCHESIQHIRPSARSLTMRFHLKYEAGVRLFAREERKYETVFAQRKTKKLSELTKGRQKLEYIRHYVDSCAMRIDLCADRYYIVDMDADRVEIDWIE